MILLHHPTPRRATSSLNLLSKTPSPDHPYLLHSETCHTAHHRPGPRPSPLLNRSWPPFTGSYPPFRWLDIRSQSSPGWVRHFPAEEGPLDITFPAELEATGKPSLVTPPSRLKSSDRKLSALAVPFVFGNAIPPQTATPPAVVRFTQPLSAQKGRRFKSKKRPGTNRTTRPHQYHDAPTDSSQPVSSPRSSLEAQPNPDEGADVLPWREGTHLPPRNDNTRPLEGFGEASKPRSHHPFAHVKGGFTPLHREDVSTGRPRARESARLWRRKARERDLPAGSCGNALSCRAPLPSPPHSLAATNLGSARLPTGAAARSTAPTLTHFGAVIRVSFPTPVGLPSRTIPYEVDDSVSAVEVPADIANATIANPDEVRSPPTIFRPGDPTMGYPTQTAGPEQPTQVFELNACPTPASRQHAASPSPPLVTPETPTDGFLWCTDNDGKEGLISCEDSASAAHSPPSTGDKTSLEPKNFAKTVLQQSQHLLSLLEERDIPISANLLSSTPLSKRQLAPTLQPTPRVDLQVLLHLPPPRNPWLLPWAILRRIRAIHNSLRNSFESCPRRPGWMDRDQQRREVLERHDIIDKYLRTVHLRLGRPAWEGLEPHVGDLLSDLLFAEVLAAGAADAPTPSLETIAWRLWSNSGQ